MHKKKSMYENEFEKCRYLKSWVLGDHSFLVFNICSENEFEKHRYLKSWVLGDHSFLIFNVCSVFVV